MSALALVLLAVLLAATGAAWLLTERSAEAAAGEFWYIQKDARGVPVGWMVARSGPGEPLGRAGYQVLGDDEGARIASRWQINDQATEGRYVALAPKLLANQTVAAAQTRIHLAGGQIQVSQTVARRTFQGALAVGPNYVAEGTREDLIAQVARSGQEFAGEIFLDDRMSLAPIRLTPAEPGTQPQTAPAHWPRQVWEGFAGPSGEVVYTAVYHVDEAGRIVQIDSLNAAGQVIQRSDRVDPQAVEKLFPDAFAQRNRLLRRLTLD